MNIYKNKIMIAVLSDGIHPYPEEYTGDNLKEQYVFDTPQEFIKKWYELDEGAWYWVLVNGKVICSGAVDPDDIEIFEAYFNMNFEEDDE